MIRAVGFVTALIFTLALVVYLFSPTRQPKVAAPPLTKAELSEMVAAANAHMDAVLTEIRMRGCEGQERVRQEECKAAHLQAMQHNQIERELKAQLAAWESEGFQLSIKAMALNAPRQTESDNKRSWLGRLIYGDP